MTRNFFLARNTCLEPSEGTQRPMDRSDEAIAKILTRENEEYRRAAEAHQRYERILEQFARRPYLAPDEEMEKKKIQKLKLAGKDRMARLISAYRREHPPRDGGSRS